MQGSNNQLMEKMQPIKIRLIILTFLECKSIDEICLNTCTNIPTHTYTTAGVITEVTMIFLNKHGSLKTVKFVKRNL